MGIGTYLAVSVLGLASSSMGSFEGPRQVGRLSSSVRFYDLSEESRTSSLYDILERGRYNQNTFGARFPNPLLGDLPIALCDGPVSLAGTSSTFVRVIDGASDPGLAPQSSDWFGIGVGATGILALGAYGALKRRA